LNEKQLYKLKQLSVVSLASSHRVTFQFIFKTKKVLSYDLLLKTLQLSDVRNLEDLLIDCFYADLCRGKLDQKGKCVEIFEALGRDVRPEDIDSLINTLSKWMDHSKNIQKNMEENSTKAQEKFEKAKKSNDDYEKKVEELKKTLKEVVESGEPFKGGKKNKF
jgi:COP9 signalosome complex subunit 7